MDRDSDELEIVSDTEPTSSEAEQMDITKDPDSPAETNSDKPDPKHERISKQDGPRTGQGDILSATASMIAKATGVKRPLPEPSLSPHHSAVPPSSPPPASLPSRPMGPPKKPQSSGYMLFATERRLQMKKAKSSEEKGNAAADAKLLGIEWNALSTEDKERYTDRVRKNKDAYRRELSDYQRFHPGYDPDKTLTVRQSNITDLQLPVSRVKKIALMNPELERITREGQHLLTKATEFFVSFHAKRVAETCIKQNRKTIAMKDFYAATNEDEYLEFLKAAFPQADQIAVQHSRAKNTQKKPPSVVPGQHITNFFQSTGQ